MKINFYKSNKSNWGELQSQVSKLLRTNLEKGVDFFVSFGNEKTSKQLRGFYRICDLVAPHMAESEGVMFDKDSVKEFVKQECGYVNLIKGRIITKSLKDATVKDMKAMIDRLYEICAFYDMKDYELTPEERRDLNEYYKLSRE